MKPSGKRTDENGGRGEAGIEGGGSISGRGDGKGAFGNFCVRRGDLMAKVEYDKPNPNSKRGVMEC